MGKALAIPQNWPPNFPYLSQPSYSPHLTKAQRQALKIRHAEITTEIPANFPKGPSSLVKITPITNPSHPAYKQRGLFAARNLAAGALVIPYHGIMHSSIRPHSSAHEKSDYDLWLDRESGVAVDAMQAGNEARFVNDYRGVKYRPNAEFRECWDARWGQKCMAVFVLPAGKNMAKKGMGGIAKGDEICVSYGKGFWGKRRAEQGGSEEALEGNHLDASRTTV